MTPEAIAEMIEGGREFVPDQLWPGLRRYFVDRIRPGGFLCALIANDLRGAVCRADSEQLLLALLPVSRFLSDYAPPRSHGSAEALESWLAPQAAEQ